MNTKLNRVIKFAIVYANCFLIDYLLGLLLMNVLLATVDDVSFAALAVLASVVGFLLATILNYILSFKFLYLFDDKSKKKYIFIAFIFLSITAFLINSLIVWIGVGTIYENYSSIHEKFSYNMIFTISKIFAAFLVTVYDAITRHILIEKIGH